MFTSDDYLTIRSMIRNSMRQLGGTDEQALESARQLLVLDDKIIAALKRQSGVSEDKEAA